MFLLMGLIILGLMVSGYFLFVDKILPGISGKSTAATDKNKEVLPGNSEAVSDSVLAATDGDGQIITLYFSAKDKDKLIREIRKIPQEKMLLTLAGNIISELLKGPVSPEARRTIPEGTIVRSIFFNQGIFYLDLSREFIDKHPGGAAEEVLAVYSIVNTLTELDKKAKVKILINGVETETMKGHLGMRQLFTRFEPLLASNL
ncbi:MAG: GerMN domain-containing protein [Candidatus Riflebacteria bacterium]|nr:GerMN domain-containing protein [Candidatus Riflebacteria bacterium]